MKKKFIFFLILLIVNLLFVQFFKTKITLQEVSIIHSFIFTLSFLTDSIQIKISQYKKITQSHFLIINFTRMFLCIVFLLPIILNYNKSYNIYIYNFFFIYFSYLFSDLIFKHKNPNKINIFFFNYILLCLII